MESFEKPRLGLYEKAISNTLEWEDKLCLSRQSGYDFLELSVDAERSRLSRLYDPGFAPCLLAAMEKTGVRVLTMALTANRRFPLGSESAHVREEGLEIARRAIRLASDTGIRVVHLAAYDELGENRNCRTGQLFREAARALAREAEANGVMAAFETMDSGGYCGMEEMLSLLNGIGSPFLKCYADIGNLTATGHDPAEAFLKGKGSIVGVHLKDALPGVCRDVPFGEGIVNFEKGVQALGAMEYSGFFVAEMWSYDDVGFHKSLLPASRFLRRWLDAAYQ